MEMQQIRYFLAAARELNFTRAAMACNVSQPSLTRAIGLLESELGGDLFRRERNLTHLTDLGKRLLPLLARTIENADQAALLARSMSASKLVSLTLGLPEGIALEPFVPHLLELAKAFADFDVKVRRGALADLTQGLREGDIDMLLGPRPEDPWERFEHWPLYDCTYSLVFRADHPLSAKPVIAAADLQGRSLLHRPYCRFSTGLGSHLSDAGVTLSPALEFTRDDDILACLAASHAIALLPDELHLRALLTRRKLEVPDLGYRVQATTVSGRQRGAALSLFLTQLRAARWQTVTA